MSAAGRYRKLYPRIWRHPGFRGLTETAQRITLYILTGPQTNRVGLFCFSVATAAEDLKLGVETLRKRLADLLVTFGWHFDADARVFYIPSWWKWNQPENPNVLKGNLKDLNEIPPCALTDAFARNLATLDETLHQTFIECCRQRIPEPPRIQEQEQETGTGKQEQEPALMRGGPARPLSTQRMTSNGHSNHEEPKSDDLKTARQVLQLDDPNAPMDHLLDAFSSLCCGRPFVKAAAKIALNTALAERRCRRQ